MTSGHREHKKLNTLEILKTEL